MDKPNVDQMLEAFKEFHIKKDGQECMDFLRFMAGVQSLWANANEPKDASPQEDK